MPIAWHLKRWWNFCMSEDQKKKNRTDFYVGSIRHGDIDKFCLLRY